MSKKKYEYWLNDMIDIDAGRAKRVPISLPRLKCIEPDPPKIPMPTGGDLHRATLKVGAELKIAPHHNQSISDQMRARIAHNGVIARRVAQWLKVKKLPDVIEGDKLIALLPDAIRRLQPDDKKLMILVARAVTAQGGGKIRVGKSGKPRMWALRDVEKHRPGRGKRTPMGDSPRPGAGHCVESNFAKNEQRHCVKSDFAEKERAARRPL